MAKAHGLISISLFFLTQVLALTTLLLEFSILGLAYVALLVVALLVIIYFYCAKCPVRLTDCGHVIVGPVTRIFPDRKEEGYTKLDYTAVIGSLTLLILLPQVWLWKYPEYLAGFWIALVMAGAEINHYVCTRCNNVHCIGCKKTKMLS